MLEELAVAGLLESWLWTVDQYADNNAESIWQEDKGITHNKLLYCSIEFRTPKDMSTVKHTVENAMFFQSLFGIRAVFPALTR